MCNLLPLQHTHTNTCTHHAYTLHLSPFCRPPFPLSPSPSSSPFLLCFFTHLISSFLFPSLSPSLSPSLPSSSLPTFLSPSLPLFLSLSDEDEEDLDEEEEEPEQEQEIQTVVYFWQGRDAGKMGWLHFTLGYRHDCVYAQVVCLCECSLLSLCTDRTHTWCACVNVPSCPYVLTEYTRGVPV